VNCAPTICNSWLNLASVSPNYAWIAARWGSWVKVLELWTANTILSMWTVAGTDSKNVARSVCGLEVTNSDGGLDMVYTVGGRWFVGIRATGSGGISTTVGWVGGRDS
jgi:hypothetical protein